MLPRFAFGIPSRGALLRSQHQSHGKVAQAYNFSSGRICQRGPQAPKESKAKKPIKEKEEKNLWPGIMEPSKAIMGLEAETVFRLPSPQSPTIQKLLGDYKLIMAQHSEDGAKASPALVTTAQLPQTPDAVDGVAATILEEKVEMDRQDIDMASFITKAGANDDMFYADPSMFRMGDLVYGNSTLGIVVSKAGRRFVLLTPVGSFLTVNSFSIRFHLPNFLETKPAKEMIEGTLSHQVVSRFAAGEGVEQALPLLARLIGQVDTWASSFTMKNHRDLLGLAAKYQQPDHQVEVKVAAVGHTLLGREPEPHELVGLFRFMASNTVEFAKCQEKRNTLLVHSKARVGLYDELLQLAAKPHALNHFINKAAKLIKYRTQKFPNPHHRIVNTSYLGFSPHTLVRAQNHPFPPCSGITFTDVDHKIIQGIWDFIRTEKITNVSPLLPLVTAILKPLRYSYVCALDALEFLKDIGVLRQWENPWLGDLPLDPPPASPSAIDDACSAIRKDLGDTLVYTIDSPDAKEIDDGISIEVVDASHAWLHVHIADPTTAVAPGSDLDRHCQTHPTTVYNPDITFPMLPKWLTQGPCSLSPAPNKTKYVMTFSALLDGDGTIQASTIHPSRIRNTKAISYDQANHALGLKSTTLECGSHPPTSPPPSTPAPVSPASVKDLKLISEFALSHFANRQRNGCLYSENINAQFKVSPHPLARTTNFAPTEPSYDDQLPTISYQVERSHQQSSNNVVAECMVIAGRVAAQYFKKHNIPALYPTQQPPDLTARPELAQLLKHIAKTKCPMSQQDLMALKDHLNFSYIDTSPGANFSMGIHDGYVRVTSPLRRYLDLLLHWQLKHHLLNPTAKPLFSADQLAMRFISIHTTLAKMRILEKRTQRFWLLNYLARIEAECVKSPDTLPQAFPSIVKGFIRHALLRNPQAIYRGKLQMFLPEKDEWIAHLVPFGAPVHFSIVGFPTPDELRPGLEVEMIIHTLAPDVNAIKFSYIPEPAKE